MLNTIKKFVLGEWGRRLGYTGITVAILALAALGPALFVNWGMGALALLLVTAFFAKFDDMTLRGWLRPVVALGAFAAGGFMLYAGYAGYELLNRIVMAVSAFVVLAYGSVNTANFIEREVRKELADD